MEFSKNGKSIILKKSLEESDDNFYKRGNFIITQPNLNNLNDLIKISKIWINYKIKKCSYSNNLVKEINKLEKNL